jgi:alpha-amylase
MKKSCKTIICFLLVAVLALGAIVSVSASELPLYGDVDKDGTITVADATEVGKYLAELTAFDDAQLKVADYNGDGKINIEDATNIQKMLVSINYKYTHELYEVEYTKFATDELTPLEFTLDKSINDYYRASYYDYSMADPYCYGGKEDDTITVFKTYDEYSRFFEDTFDEYNEEFFEENALIFMFDFSDSSYSKTVLDNAYVKDNVLYLETTEWAAGEGMMIPDDADITFWNDFIIVDKASVESVDKICVDCKFSYYTESEYLEYIKE